MDVVLWRKLEEVDVHCLSCSVYGVVCTSRATRDAERTINAIGVRAVRAVMCLGAVQWFHMGAGVQRHKDSGCVVE